MFYRKINYEEKQVGTPHHWYTFIYLVGMLPLFDYFESLLYTKNTKLVALKPPLLIIKVRRNNKIVENLKATFAQYNNTVSLNLMFKTKIN
jgi:hypothetical protein